MGWDGMGERDGIYGICGLVRIAYRRASVSFQKTKRNEKKKKRFRIVTAVTRIRERSVL